VLFDCARCGGQFVEHALLRDMLHRHEHAVLANGVSRVAPMPDARTGYIPCPACSTLMNRKNFGEMSGVIVDICRQHGTWFDLGELPRVLAFVAAGGLERSRQRAEEEDARSKRAAHVAATVIAMPVSSHDASVTYSSGASSLAHMFVDLLLR
jgi:Zn-finger nucleic acid-binding protein